jgi:hypothetical protein
MQDIGKVTISPISSLLAALSSLMLILPLLLSLVLPVHLVANPMSRAESLRSRRVEAGGRESPLDSAYFPLGGALSSRALV